MKSDTILTITSVILAAIVALQIIVTFQDVKSGTLVNVTNSSGSEHVSDDATQNEDNNTEFDGDVNKDDKVENKYNLNEATFDDLIKVPNIGEKKALAILKTRDDLGGFTDISQLKEVKGIGDKIYSEIKDYFYIKK